VPSRIFIVGSGVVGAATGQGFLAAGHHVAFVDISPQRVRELAARGLDLRTELDLSGEPESLIFLTLPTPNDGHRYDLSAFIAGTASVGRAMAGALVRHTVIVRSTVPPGTTDGPVRSVFEEHSEMIANEDFGLASNPEFLRAASAAETKDRLAAIVDHEIDTADITDRAANHVQLRKAAHQHEPA
jgi:UDPglucose 6-dehydrogenase